MACIVDLSRPDRASEKASINECERGASWTCGAPPEAASPCCTSRWSSVLRGGKLVRAWCTAPADCSGREGPGASCVSSDSVDDAISLAVYVGDCGEMNCAEPGGKHRPAAGGEARCRRGGVKAQLPNSPRWRPSEFCTSTSSSVSGNTVKRLFYNCDTCAGSKKRRLKHEQYAYASETQDPGDREQPATLRGAVRSHTVGSTGVFRLEI